MARTNHLTPRALRLSGADWKRVRAVAVARGITPATALRQLVLAGLDAADESRHGPLTDIEESLTRIRALLHRLGPPIIGLPHLLAYWATREAEDIDADELVAEFTANAQAVWRDVVAARTEPRPPETTP